MYIKRNIKAKVVESLKNYPITIVVGPRQCGKSTLVKHILEQHTSSIYLDLYRPSDLMKFDEVEWFLSSQKGKLICIDEIQRKPELLPLLRIFADEWNTPGCFLVLGSTSPDLLKYDTEALAGRIAYQQLTPFLWKELNNGISIQQYFAAGGFPRSILAKSEISFEWRENFIMTFLDQYLIQYSEFRPTLMHRLWRMLAHNNGQIAGYGTLSHALEVSVATVRDCIHLLIDAFMLHTVPSYPSDLDKQLVKAPKIYVADSGIAATLLGLRNFEEMAGHPSFAGVWESIVLANLRALFPEASFYYYRTNKGAEIDLVMKIRDSVFAIVCKPSMSSKLSKENYDAINQIVPTHTLIVSHVGEGWRMSRGIDVVSLEEAEEKIRDLIS